MSKIEIKTPKKGLKAKKIKKLKQPVFFNQIINFVLVFILYNLYFSHIFLIYLFYYIIIINYKNMSKIID